jgi:hypothetical protein
MANNGWQKPHVDMHIQFWSNIEHHKWHYSRMDSHQRALLTYQGNQRCNWHATIGGPQAFNLALINEDLLNDTLNKIVLGVSNEHHRLIRTCHLAPICLCQRHSLYSHFLLCVYWFNPHARSKPCSLALPTHVLHNTHNTGTYHTPHTRVTGTHTPLSCMSLVFTTLRCYVRHWSFHTLHSYQSHRGHHQTQPLTVSARQITRSRLCRRPLLVFYAIPHVLEQWPKMAGFTSVCIVVVHTLKDAFLSNQQPSPTQ